MLRDLGARCYLAPCKISDKEVAALQLRLKSSFTLSDCEQHPVFQQEKGRFSSDHRNHVTQSLNILSNVEIRPVVLKEDAQYNIFNCVLEIG